MKAKKLVKAVRNGLSKNQLAEVAKREAGKIAAALRSVVLAGSADGNLMLSLHSLHTHGLKCVPAVTDAIASLGAPDNKDTAKTRKTRLLSIATAVDGSKMVMFKGKKELVGNLLGKRNPETGSVKPGSMQGIYALLNPSPAKTQQQHRDWVNEQILQLMDRDGDKGGGLWMLAADNAKYLKSEYERKAAEAKAAAEEKAAAKAA